MCYVISEFYESKVPDCKHIPLSQKEKKGILKSPIEEKMLIMMY